VNSSYEIISFTSNKDGTKQTSLIKDVINKRIIEKWISFQLKNNDLKFIITDRYLYVYNSSGGISQILEIKKGVDKSIYDNIFNDNNEYCHSIKRYVKYEDRGNREEVCQTEIIYSRNNYIGSKRKRFFLKSMLLDIDKRDIYDNKINVRLNTVLLNNGKVFQYTYSKDNFNELLFITEYKILLDLRIFNKFLKITGIPILMNRPYFFIKKEIKKKSVKSIYSVSEVKSFNQDYYFSGEIKNVYINDIIYEEDLFIHEKMCLESEFDKYIL
jgi:hypothetical protein